MTVSSISRPLTPGSFFKPYIPLEKGAAEGFAQEMTRRAAQTALPEGATRTVDDKGLSAAIQGAVGFVEDTFGDQAARTFMGIALKHASDKAMGEDEMGDAFVNGLEFLDRTFGTAAGDKAMAFFNGQLNDALNGYFQNGHDESFLAVDADQAADQLAEASGAAVAAVMQKFTADAADSASLLMDSAKDDQEETLDKSSQGNGRTVMAGRVDENGNPVGTGDAASAGGETTRTGQAGQTAEGASVAKPVKRVAGAKRRRGTRVRRRRVNSSNPYDKSGLTPGQVLNKTV